ncbi:MAG: hypothetical protein GTO14_17470 [Anaerolineales bacterium]|nr:hypothetical protein [Anaerolineales bacterium]
MRLSLAALGFTLSISQFLLMREMVATFYGNELLFGLVLTVWLGWVAVGAWGLGRLIVHTIATRTWLALGFVSLGILLPAQLTIIRNSRNLLNVPPGAFAELGPTVLVIVVTLAPLCLLAGLLFTLGVRMIIERGGSAGHAYVWEGLGAFVGGVSFSFFLIHHLDPYQTALVISTVDIAISVRLLLDPLSNRRILRLAPVIALALGIPIALSLGQNLHINTLRHQYSRSSTGSAYELLFAADSPYGRLVIQARDGQRVFFENGLLAFETQGTFPEEVAHFPLLSHPDPKTVLLIGGGVAGDVREILKHPIEQMTYVELDPLRIEAAQLHLPSEEALILDNPRVDLDLNDGRVFIKQTKERFDVIILDLPEPSTGTLNRFYTQEFFNEVRSILNPGGVFALGLPSAENYLSPELARRNGSVFHTLRAIFAQVVVLPGEHNFFLSSNTTIQLDPADLVERLHTRGIETSWVTPAYIEYTLTTGRFDIVRRELEAIQGVPINHDLSPICYYYDLALWLSRFYPNLRGAFEGASLFNLWWIAAPLFLCVLIVRLLRASKREPSTGTWTVTFITASVGLSQMILQVVILFAFQVFHGSLFADVSLIVAAFMAGLTMGGTSSTRLLETWALQRKARAKYGLMVVLMTNLILSFTFLLFTQLPFPAPRFAFPLTAMLAGALAGLAFPFSVTLVKGDRSRTAGMLYGADLVGGCLGAILTTGLFVPILGIPQTCLLVAIVSLSGLLILG